MSYFAPPPVVSGDEYTVEDVEGHDVRAVDDLVGEVTLMLSRNGAAHRIAGSGVIIESGVRFYQKNLDHDGKDVRVWWIHQSSGSANFVAEHAPAVVRTR